MVAGPPPPMLKYLVVSWLPGRGPPNGAAETEEEPITTPEFPDAEKVAPSAALGKFPGPAPLFGPTDTPSNVSVARPSETFDGVSVGPNNGAGPGNFPRAAQIGRAHV